MNIFTNIISPILLLLYLASVISATEKKRKPVVITGDNVKTRLVGTENGKKIYLTEVTGHPRIKYNSKELRARKIIIRGNDGEISEAIGNVVLSDRENKSKVYVCKINQSHPVKEESA